MLDLQAARGLKLKHHAKRWRMAVTASDDPAEAADRLEQALERIAALSAERMTIAAAHRPAQAAVLPSGADTGEIAARLDALIARVRNALDAPAS